MKKSLDTVVLGGVAIALLTLGAYWPALGSGFIWDDDAYVTGNELLRAGHGLERIWFELGATQQYYPMVFTTFWLEYHLWGLDPYGFHLVNVLLHVLGALLLWRLLVRLQVPGAWLVAAVFALHPVQVESVAWITERKNVLSGVFYFAAALAYLRFVAMSDAKGRDESSERGWREKAAHLLRNASGPWGRWVAYLAALVLFMAALLSKTVTCSLPAALLLIHWWKRGTLRWRDVLPLVPFFVIGMRLGLLTAHIEKHDLGAQGADWSLTFVERFLIAGRVLWFYAGKLIYPAKLTFIYPRWAVDVGEYWHWLFLAAAVGVIIALWLLRRRLGRGPLTGVLFFCGTLFPALGFVNVYPMRFSFVADHFQYLASVGLITLAASGLYRLLRTGSVVLLVILGILTWHQTKIYEGPETLWRDTLAKNPNCWMAYNNLGNILFDQGQVDEATTCYRKALVILPNYADAHANLGNVLFQQGQVDEAIIHYRKALETNATISTSSYFNNANYRYSLGNALRRNGQLDEALTQFRKALEIWPGFAEAQCNLGDVLLQKGQVDDAITCYQKALEIQPYNAHFHYSYGRALLQNGQLDAAKAELLEALQISQRYGSTSNAELLCEIAKVSIQEGKMAEARSYLEEAMRIHPHPPEVPFKLALILTSEGRFKEATTCYRDVLDLKSDWTEALNNLAWILATNPDPNLRDGPEAARLAEHACELTHYETPKLVSTLAAAFAEAGRFDEAVATGEKARALAQAAGQKVVAEWNAGLVELYRAKRPYRDGVESDFGGTNSVGTGKQTKP